MSFFLWTISHHLGSFLLETWLYRIDAWLVNVCYAGMTKEIQHPTAICSSWSLVSWQQMGIRWWNQLERSNEEAFSRHHETGPNLLEGCNTANLWSMVILRDFLWIMIQWSLSHCLQGFMHPRSLAGFLSIHSRCFPAPKITEPNHLMVFLQFIQPSRFHVPFWHWDLQFDQ